VSHITKRHFGARNESFVPRGIQTSRVDDLDITDDLTIEGAAVIDGVVPGGRRKERARQVRKKLHRRCPRIERRVRTSPKMAGIAR
jgi:hypothetical protein